MFTVHKIHWGYSLKPDSVNISLPELFPFQIRSTTQSSLATLNFRKPFSNFHKLFNLPNSSNSPNLSVKIVLSSKKKKAPFTAGSLEKAPSSYKKKILNKSSV